MKKITLLSLLLTHATLGLADTSGNLPESVLKNIIQRDITQAQAAVSTLKTTLQTASNGKPSEAVNAAFTDVVTTWKAVQTSYVAGDLATEVVDTPRLIDTYHNGKENLSEQLSRIIKRDDDAEEALFKNSYKSINAVAFYLFSNSQISETERLYAIYALSAIEAHLKAIANAYQVHSDAFLENSDLSMSYLLNALIDSSYKLKEWRIGDPAGLSRKYKDEPDSRRQEYPYSQRSWDAILAILAIHDDMMGNRDYANLGSAAIEQGAKAEVEHIRQLLKTARAQANQLKENGTQLSDTAQITSLFSTLDELNTAYYQSLLKALPIQAKILDADGD